MRPSGSSRRRVAAIGAFALLLSIQGCVFLLPDSIRAASEFRNVLDELDQSLQIDGPEIDVVLNAATGDAITVFLPNEASKRFKIAEQVASALGVASPIAEQDAFEPDTATVQLDRRLPTRDGEKLTFNLDTAPISEIVHNEGYTGYYLFLCHPVVKAQLDSDVPQDLVGPDSFCYHGGGWTITDEDFHASLTLLPDVSRYFAWLAGVILGLVMLGALAWFVGDQLRRGPFRRRNPAAVALGLIVGILLALFLPGVVAATGAAVGPVDNLAVAKDLGVGMYALATALPALAAVFPGITFLVLLVRRRPWPDEPDPHTFPGWPVPPPPGPPGSPPPPPIPSGVR